MSRLIALTTILLAGPAFAEEALYPGYTWQDLGRGIYLHTQIDPLAAPVDGNTTVIVSDAGILVVDTGINPAVVRAVVAKIRTLSDKPVTHVVNTHWHDDHVNGNYVYRQAFPDAQFIAHRETLGLLRERWEAMEEQREQAYASVDTGALRETAERLDASDPATAIGYRVYAGYVDALRPELAGLEYVFPDTVFGEKLVYDMGNRTVQILWPGQGNTPGDAVVWLEEERVLVTGDLVVAPVPFAFDAPMVEWVAALERLETFDAATIVPGHGPVQHDATYIRQVRELLEDTLSAVRAAQAEGAGFDNLSQAIDLEDQRRRFAGDDPLRNWAWNAFFVSPGLKSAWKSLGFPVPAEE